MIKSNEFREGNLLYDSVGHIGSVVIGLGVFEVATKERGFLSLQECNPIPLTPEILEKAGFENETQESDYRLNLEGNYQTIYFSNEKVAFVYSGLGDPESYGFKVKCEFVHQLQNLYHALTGEELKV